MAQSLVFGFISSVRKFFLIPFHEKMLFFEALVTMLSVRIKIAFVPMKQLWPRLGEMQKETDTVDLPHQYHFVYQVSHAVVRCRKIVKFKDRCYPEAITAKQMLRKRGIASTLYIGVRKETGKVNAHAWLRSGSIFVTGKREMGNFVVLSTIA